MTAISGDMVRLDGTGIMRLHAVLYSHFGDPRWWPGDTPFEICVGAILTQNTAWSNVEKAIGNLKAEELLDPVSILDARTDLLGDLIRPVGYYNQKTVYLREFSAFLMGEWGGEPSRMADEDTPSLRKRLLEIRGIGSETADSILNYALDKPIFVVDAYTRRIFHRVDGDDRWSGPYDRLQRFVMENVRGDHLLYNRLHALLVYLGKDHCRKNPLCGSCPAAGICDIGSRTSS